MPVDAVRLVGRHVTLEPLEARHAEALAHAVEPADDVWTYMTSAPRTADDMRAWIAARLSPRTGLDNLAFAQVAPDGRVMGSTSLFDIDAQAHSAEIGFTWLAAPFRGTLVNVEAKSMLLRHAFETLGLRRVQLMTNANNLRSQRAMARIGATREGVLRNFRRNLDGTLRDSAVYSVIDSDWPRVRSHLDDLLAGSVGRGGVKKA